MWTRRETLVGGTLTLLFGARNCACANAVTAPHSTGCVLADADFNLIYPDGTPTTPIHGDEPIIYKSGDRAFDFALAQTLGKISKMFEVTPGFAYYDDSGSENAYATPRVRMKRTDDTELNGTVLFGLNLFQRLRRQPEAPEVMIAGVCAHEFGHIIQYKHGLIRQVNAGQDTSKRCELQADYFAGWFAGNRKKERPSFPAAVIALGQYNFGDTNYGSKTHHGTPEERGKAVVRGFEDAFVHNKRLNEAIEASTAYVLTL